MALIGVRRALLVKKKTIAAAPGLIATTWNPSDKSSGITLTGSNLIATNASGSGIDGVRSVDSTSGKVYFEITWTVYPNVDGSGVMQVGVANASAVLTTTLLGQTTAAGLRDDGLALYNFGPNSITSPFNSGLNDVIGVAIDFPNKKIWFRMNGALWDNNASDDPATNTGGLDFTGITGPVFAITNSNSFSFASTANFGATSFGTAAPSGFGILGH